MGRAEVAHKGAGWIGVALACVTLATVYLERDTAKLQAAQAAAHARVDAVDEVSTTLREVRAQVIRTATALDEREKEVDRLRSRVVVLESRLRIASPAPVVASVPDVDFDGLTVREVFEKPTPVAEPRRERIEQAQAKIVREAF